MPLQWRAEVKKKKKSRSCTSASEGRVEEEEEKVYLGNGGQSRQEVQQEGVMPHIEMRDEAPVHDELPLEVVHHTEAHAEPHANVYPVH